MPQEKVFKFFGGIPGIGKKAAAVAAAKEIAKGVSKNKSGANLIFKRLLSIQKSPKVFPSLSVAKSLSRKQLAKIATGALGTAAGVGLTLATTLAKPAKAMTVKQWAREKGPTPPQMPIRRRTALQRRGTTRTKAGRRARYL